MSKGGCGNFVFPVVPDVTTQNRKRDLYFQFQFPRAHFHHYTLPFRQICLPLKPRVWREKVRFTQERRILSVFQSKNLTKWGRIAEYTRPSLIHDSDCSPTQPLMCGEIQIVGRKRLTLLLWTASCWSYFKDHHFVQEVSNIIIHNSIQNCVCFLYKIGIWLVNLTLINLVHEKMKPIAFDEGRRWPTVTASMTVGLHN